MQRFLTFTTPGVLQGQLDQFLHKEISQWARSAALDQDPGSEPDVLHRHLELRSRSVLARPPEALVERIDRYFQREISAYQQQWDEVPSLWNRVVDLEDPQLCLAEIWLNRQMPGDFLPLHNHMGIFSWVIWVDLPYDLAQSQGSKQGCFEFVYTDSLGRLRSYTIAADRRYEAGTLLFPSTMYHQVYPTNSHNQLRIALSGNYRLRERASSTNI